jgi:hypothetical protein
MKYRLSILLLLLSFSVYSFGQADSLGKSKRVNLVSKRGVYILPEQGELALGIDAFPFLLYMGNSLLSSGSFTPSINYANNFGDMNGIYAKYMIQSDLAIRANFRFDFGSYTDVYPVSQSSLTPDPLAPMYVDDQVTYISDAIQLAVGIEKMRGKGRVQGKYGAEILFGYNKYTSKYNYGNSITNDFNTPVTFSNIYTAEGGRIINDYIDKGLFLGARGFLGVEFFVGPKISLGGEFGYAFIYQWDQNRTLEYQYWNSSQQEVSTFVRESYSDGIDDMSVGIDNLDGSISLFFYF